LCLSLKCEVIEVVWLSAHPSKCRGDLCCALLLVWRLYCLREELCTPDCITQILSGGSLCGKSCVDDIVKILLCEGGDVEQWFEPRNISLCLRLIHYLLTLSLSYIVPYIISYCSYHTYMLGIVCVPHLC